MESDDFAKVFIEFLQTVPFTVGDILAQAIRAMIFHTKVLNNTSIITTFVFFINHMALSCHNYIVLLDNSVNLKHHTVVQTCCFF